MLYRHLIDSNYQVNVGKLGDKEIDFIASKGDVTIYIQVALNVSDEKTSVRITDALIDEATANGSLDEQGANNEYKNLLLVR